MASLRKSPPHLVLTSGWWGHPRCQTFTLQPEHEVPSFSFSLWPIDGIVCTSAANEITLNRTRNLAVKPSYSAPPASFLSLERATARCIGCRHLSRDFDAYRAEERLYGIPGTCSIVTPRYWPQGPRFQLPFSRSTAEAALKRIACSRGLGSRYFMLSFVKGHQSQLAVPTERVGIVMWLKPWKQSVKLFNIWQNNCELGLSVRSRIMGVTQFVKFVLFGACRGTFSQEIILSLVIGILNLCFC